MSLPKVGEHFGAGFTPSVLSTAHGLRLVSGSTLVAPPGDSTCGTGGWVAVLRVDGNSRAVLQQYTRQLEALGWNGEIRETSFDSATILKAGSDESGGGLFVVEAVVRPGSPTYLRIESCFD